jgi:hypothetical protein
MTQLERVIKGKPSSLLGLAVSDEGKKFYNIGPRSQYESQKHDLFLPDYQNAGYLTANPGVAGYLTTTRKTAPTNVPPPMDDSNASLDNSNPLL